METNKLGVEKTKLCIDNLGLVLVEAITLLKYRFSWDILSSIYSLMKSIKQIASSAQYVLPELKDLDKDEAAMLTEAAYQAVRRVFMAVGSSKKT